MLSAVASQSVSGACTNPAGQRSPESALCTTSACSGPLASKTARREAFMKSMDTASAAGAPAGSLKSTTLPEPTSAACIEPGWMPPQPPSTPTQSSIKSTEGRPSALSPMTSSSCMQIVAVYCAAAASGGRSGTTCTCPAGTPQAPNQTSCASSWLPASPIVSWQKKTWNLPKSKPGSFAKPRKALATPPPETAREKAPFLAMASTAAAAVSSTRADAASTSPERTRTLRPSARRSSFSALAVAPAGPPPCGPGAEPATSAAGAGVGDAAESPCAGGVAGASRSAVRAPAPEAALGAAPTAAVSARAGASGCAGRGGAGAGTPRSTPCVVPCAGGGGGRSGTCPKTLTSSRRRVSSSSRRDGRLERYTRRNRAISSSAATSPAQRAQLEGRHHQGGAGGAARKKGRAPRAVHTGRPGAWIAGRQDRLGVACTRASAAAPQ
mmetsp:Transcript_39024/g.124056  ORF Transcript_39024/g.124056 Transcript_39024/m.124056 type:complete len:440 (+) Transcript_39024:167-1486(+)